MATASANSDTALLTEHFGYPPVSLLDDIINTVNLLAEKALDNVEQGLLAQPPENLGFRASHASKSSKKDAAAASQQPQSSAEEAARHEIENGTHQLETLLCASIDRNFDKFELYVMRNILCVRPEDRDWIRLGHYEGLSFDDGAADGPSVESLSRLRARLQASQKLNCMLHAERARNEALLSELRALMGAPAAGAPPPRVKKEEDAEDAEPEGAGGDTRAAFGFLRDRGDLADGDAETPLTTTTAFTLSQMQALRALSTSLRTMRPDLKEGTDAAADAEGKKGWRRERLEYVEIATRRHLEHVRQLELGEKGEVRDGEWQGEGRKLGKGEVEELENVASILGDGQGSSSKEDKMDET
ncbi:Kinetochore-associated protein MTW1 [Pleurostoma richardsiae]|uniref:Kinetochore-associated protein MTW1 n=1 Tax=Pleurostoma richardsiae TaxID=41990 RepID=A0AA38RNE2_9PEZI|nr:Kinetochore-associated protein MTW1 [Pleurostoma richardsiae]